MGQLEETVREWVPEQRLVVDIDEAKGLPIKKGVATFTMKQAAADATDFTLEYEYSALPIVGAAMRRQLAKGFSGFLDSLERAALTG